MHATPATLLPFCLSLASLSSALALPNTASTAPTPGDFKLHTVTYDPEYNTDVDAWKKFNNLYIGYVTDANGVSSLTGSFDQPGAPIWTLDGATHTLSASTASSHSFAGALVLSNMTNTASTPLKEVAGAYHQATLDQSGASPSQFSIEQDTTTSGNGSAIAYYGSKDYTLIFGSFVMCEVPNAAGSFDYTLLWRGSSKAVWKAPAGCALVKLGLDYELYAHPTPASA